MKRLLLVLGMTVGLLVQGITTADAGFWCQDDPLIGIGLPITYSVTPTISADLLGQSLYINAILQGNQRYQRVAASIGID